MRKGLLAIMFLGWLFGPPSIVQKATEAYNAQKYAEAAAGFTTEFENYPTQHSALNFNIAQSWFKLDSIAKATTFYGKVTNVAKESPQMGSWAWNNLGCIFSNAQPGAGGMPGQMSAQMPGQAQAGGPNPQQQDAAPASPLEQALQAFKDALKLDHDNELARFNYELIKRKIQQQQQQNQDQNEDQKEDQKQDQKQDDQKDQQNQPKNQQNQPKNQENKADQKKPGEGENPQEMSAAEAERLLEAMNSNEKKFLQQLEKGKKLRTYNEDGPDW
jgi:hypothetical protein